MMARHRSGEQFDDVASALKGGDKRQAEVIWRRMSKEQTRRIRALGAHVADEVMSIADRRSNQVTQEHLDDLKALAGELLLGMELEDSFVRAELKSELAQHFATVVVTDGELNVQDPNPPNLMEWVKRAGKDSLVAREWEALQTFINNQIAIVSGIWGGDDEG